MVFRFYSKQLSEATKSISAWIFVVGLMLVGFGLLILLLSEIFIYVAAGLFFLAGAGVMMHAVKLFFAARRMGGPLGDDSRDAHRENVRIHGENEA